MTATKTLLQLAGADLSLPRLSDASLVLIDLQNEYRAGPIALPGADAAIANAEKLLARARSSGATVFHVAHRGRSGGLFDRATERGAIVAALAPLADEPVIEKELPNAFAGTELQARLQVGAGEGVGQFLLDHRLVGQRSQRGDDGAAFGGAIEQAALPSAMHDMKHRSAAAPRPRQQFFGVRDRGIGIGQGDRACAIFVLQVDQHEAGIAEPGKAEVGTGKLEQGFCGGHGFGIFQSETSSADSAPEVACFHAGITQPVAALLQAASAS